MIDKNLKLKDKEKIVLYMIKSYKRAKRNINLQELRGGVQESAGVYKEDLMVIYLVDSTLQECNEDSKRILHHEYFVNSASNWYLEFYSKSTFYRLKHRAIEEFIDFLNL